MKHRIVLGVCAVALLAAAGAIAGDSLKSGPQVGKNIPGPFDVLNVTGPSADQKNCQVWLNGGKPVAMIFAREVSDSLTSLVKKIDAENSKNGKMGSFVVFLSDDEKLGDKLKSVAKAEGIKKTVLTIMDNPTGPPKYEVAKDASVTVVFYTNRKVVANHAFKKGELNAAAVEKVLADLPKIFETKKKDAK